MSFSPREEKGASKLLPSASLRALLSGAIDYAGLFPPASLALDAALQNHAESLRSLDAWMLGAFVLPVAKFEEAATKLERFDLVHPLRVSALGPKTDTPAQFRVALEKAAEAIRSFNARHGASAGIIQIEMALLTKTGLSAVETARALGELDAPIFWEAPADEAERVIDFLASHKPRERSRVSGFKLRTGGVIASAFPSSVQIARALVAAAQARVPIKFTAGLHHPVRRFHPSVQTKMHGFLNVLGAGVLAAEHGWNQQETAAMLEDEDHTSFQFDDTTFSWREWKVTTERIQTHRALITSLGSCSFDEPREDLRALSWL